MNFVFEDYTRPTTVLSLTIDLLSSKSNMELIGFFRNFGYRILTIGYTDAR